MSGRRKWSEIRRSSGPEGEAQVEQYKRALREAISLAELRRARRLTQGQLATVLDMQQPAVSRLERQTDMYLSTLRSYVEAMGGTLSLEAVFPDARVPITMLAGLGEDEQPEDAGMGVGTA